MVVARKDVEELVRILRVHLPPDPARQLASELYRSHAAEHEVSLKNAAHAIITFMEQEANPPMKISQDRLVMARGYIEEYNRMERKGGDVVQWLQIKFSCNRRNAQELYDAVQAYPKEK